MADSTSLDPLASVGAASSSAPVIPARPSQRGSAARSQTLWAGVAAVALAVLAVVAYFYWPRTSAQIGPRTTVDTPPPLQSSLSAVRKPTWGEESIVADSVWKRYLNAADNNDIPKLAGQIALYDDPWRSERWLIEFPPGLTAEKYASQLDALKIEIGLVEPSGKITYLTDIKNKTPKSRKGELAAERRFYMLWNAGELAVADKQLFQAAKVNPQGKIAAHFFPVELENAMREAEIAFAAGRPLTDIRKTTFQIASTETKFAMVVARQEYQDGQVREAAAQAAKLRPAPPPPQVAPPADPPPAEN
ncbi:MAG: hypothetical protein SFX18_19055 [Pirellulales bacterium]|nr:hypothetical protein [Pirellulales bacterium]